MTSPLVLTRTDVDREERVARLQALRGGALSSWREAQATGDLAERGPRRAALLAGLASRWHRDLDEQLEAVLERESPGPDRLRRLLGVWLDLSRATPGVRSLLTREGVDQDALRRPLLALLAQDLRAAGAPDPERSAADLLREAGAVVAAEDAAGRRLPGERRALHSAPRPRRRRLRVSWA